MVENNNVPPLLRIAIDPLSSRRWGCGGRPTNTMETDYGLHWFVSDRSIAHSPEIREKQKRSPSFLPSFPRPPRSAGQASERHTTQHNTKNTRMFAVGPLLTYREDRRVHLREIPRHVRRGQAQHHRCRPQPRLPRLGKGLPQQQAEVVCLPGSWQGVWSNGVDTKTEWGSV